MKLQEEYLIPGVEDASLCRKETAVISSYKHDGELVCNQEQIPTRKIAECYDHLKDLVMEIEPPLDIPIGLLIGMDCFEGMAPLETRIGKRGDPFAIKCKLD